MSCKNGSPNHLFELQWGSGTTTGAGTFYMYFSTVGFNAAPALGYSSRYQLPWAVRVEGVEAFLGSLVALPNDLRFELRKDNDVNLVQAVVITAGQTSARVDGLAIDLPLANVLTMRVIAAAAQASQAVVTVWGRRA